MVFVYRIHCFMAILTTVYPRFGSIIEQSSVVIPSPYAMLYLVLSIDLFKRDCKAWDDARRTVWHRFTLFDAIGGKFKKFCPYSSVRL